MSKLVFGGHGHVIRSARLELYHLTAREADWNLELVLEGEPSRVMWSGIAATPVVPGPATLELQNVDEPSQLVHDGEEILLSLGDTSELVLDQGRVHGRVVLWFYKVGGPGNAAPEEFPVEIDAMVEIVQRTGE